MKVQRTSYLKGSRIKRSSVSPGQPSSSSVLYLTPKMRPNIIPVKDDDWIRDLCQRLLTWSRFLVECRATSPWCDSRVTHGVRPHHNPKDAKSTSTTRLTRWSPDNRLNIKQQRAKRRWQSVLRERKAKWSIKYNRLKHTFIYIS